MHKAAEKAAAFGMDAIQILMHFPVAVDREASQTS
jgi:hypothetical protein